MSIAKELSAFGEYLGSGLFEEADRSLFYRKALGLRRYYENRSLPVYHGERLYPSGAPERTVMIYDSYLYGVEWDEKALDAIHPDYSRALKAEFGRYTPGVSPEHAVGGNMWNHSMPHYERILKEGFSSYRQRISQIPDPEMRAGLIHLLDGIKCYVSRCVAYLEKMHADQQLIDALKKVPFEPAKTFYEAIVCWNFVFYLDNCDNLGCVDAGLAPYYHGEADAPALLANLFANIDETGGWSMAIKPPYTELTVFCLQALKERRRPMTELFVDENTPDTIWEAAFDAVLSGSAQPAFYSPKGVLEGLKRRFPQILEEDLQQFCGGGCTESMLAGLSNVGSLDAGINLPLILTASIQKHLGSAESYEDFYQAFLADVRKTAEVTMAQIAASQEERAEWNPLPMRTLLVDDCIDRGVEYNAGGARYMWSIINFAGMINIVDSMLVIRDWVFREKKYTGAEMADLLARDDEAFLQEARKYPNCFGRDLDEANEAAYRISHDIYAMLDGHKPYLGLGYLPSSIQFNTAASAGKLVGATPDGRRGGDTLAESLGAIFARDTQGPTALLKSAASLDLQSALGMPVVNLTIKPDFDRSILKALILGYLQLGGLQLQITCVDEKTLLAAYENPQAYPNLIVRVGGFSEYFCRLSEDLRKNIVRRTLHHLK